MYYCIVGDFGTCNFCYMHTSMSPNRILFSAVPLTCSGNDNRLAMCMSCCCYSGRIYSFTACKMRPLVCAFIMFPLYGYYWDDLVFSYNVMDSKHTHPNFMFSLTHLELKFSRFNTLYVFEYSCIMWYFVPCENFLLYDIKVCNYFIRDSGK